MSPFCPPQKKTNIRTYDMRLLVITVAVVFSLCLLLHVTNAVKDDGLWFNLNVNIPDPPAVPSLLDPPNVLVSKYK